MAVWIAEHWAGLSAVAVGLLNVVLIPLIGRWARLEVAAFKADAERRFEPKHAPRTPEEQKLRIDSLGRQILSSDIIKEFADSTTDAAYSSKGFRESVENIARTSIPFQEAVDARVKHGFNNFDSTLSLALTNLGDKLSESFRKQASESQAIYMDALGDLKESMQAIAGDLRAHIAADDARREMQAKK